MCFTECEQAFVRFCVHVCAMKVYLPVFVRVTRSVITLVKHKHYNRQESSCRCFSLTLAPHQRGFCFCIGWHVYVVTFQFHFMVQTTWALHCWMIRMVNNETSTFFILRTTEDEINHRFEQQIDFMIKNF